MMWLFRPSLDPSLEERAVQEKIAQVQTERNEWDNRLFRAAGTSVPREKWVFPVDKEAMKLIEKFDELKIRNEVFEQTLSPWSRFWFRLRVRVSVFFGRLRHGVEK
jgi:hypothetical protein